MENSKRVYIHREEKGKVMESRMIESKLMTFFDSCLRRVPEFDRENRREVARGISTTLMKRLVTKKIYFVQCSKRSNF